MRCAVARPRGLDIGADRILRLRSAIGHNDWRAFIAVAEMNADRVPFTFHHCRVSVAEYLARLVSFGTRLEDGKAEALARFQHQLQIIGRFTDVANPNRTPLDFVGVNQCVTAPSLEKRGK